MRQRSMRNALEEATRLKKQQMKARPGRQAWESAPDFMKSLAYYDETLMHLRSAPFEERLAAAHELRERGSKLVREGEEEASIAEAVSLYSRALSIFLWFDRGPGNASEDIPLIDSTRSITDSQQAELATQLCAVLLNNQATCMLRLGRFPDCIYAASKALEFDPYSSRALYRRAIGSHNLGTTAGLEDAVRDLQKALSLEPGNAQVRSCLAAFQAESLEQKRKDRAIYSGMFGKGNGIYSAESDDLEIKSKKHLPETEVHGMVRDMQQNMRVAQAAEGAKEHGTDAPGLWNVFTKLPWWAWMIVIAHLVYRVFKIFGSRPLRPSASTQDISGNAGEL